MASTRMPIGRRQNDPDMLELRQAAAWVHNQALRVESFRVAISLLLAASGVFAAFINAIVPPIAVAGALWAAILAVGVNPWVKELANRAAKLQEMFDTELFDLPWNTAICGDPLPRYECSQLARRFSSRGGKVERLRDWYVSVDRIPRPYDILFCQLQNLAWDARLRRRWARSVLTFIIGWIALGAFIGYVADLTVKDTLISWYVPAMAAFILGFDNYRGQLEVASERERVLQIVQSRLNDARRPPLNDSDLRELLRLAREIQDVILATRKHTARVPNWFYTRYRSDDETDFQASADVLRTRLTGP